MIYMHEVKGQSLSFNGTLMITKIRCFFILMFIMPLINVYGTHIYDRLPVKQGFIDLSAYDPAVSKPINLDGIWEFYPNHLIPPADFSSRSVPTPRYIKVPGTWYNTKISDTEKMPATGCATFRVIVRTKAINSPLALKLPKIGLAYTLWINQQKMYTCGKPASSKNTYQSRVLPATVPFTTTTDTVEIILHVSNYDHIHGGIWYSIALGSQETVTRIANNQYSFELILFGILLIISLYNLILYINTRERSFLYFSILCFLIAIRDLQEGRNILVMFYPDFPMHVFYQIQCTVIYGSTTIFVMFLHKLFPAELNKMFMRTAQGVFVLFFLLTLITPMIFFTRLLMYYFIFLIIVVVYLYYILIRAALNKRKGAYPGLLGFVIFGLCIINDILYTNFIIKTTFLVSTGVGVFIFFQAFMLSTRFLHHSRSKIKTGKHPLFDESKLSHFYKAYNISNREQDIVTLLIKGNEYQKISDTLYISMGTVKKHIYNIYRKANVKNRLDLLHLILDDTHIQE